MALNPDAVDKTTREMVREHDWKAAVLYALGVGAKADELDFLYERRGPKVLPTYAVVPTFDAVSVLIGEVNGNLLGVVHGGQRIRLHKPFAPNDRLVTVGKVAGVYDLKRMAQVFFTTETRDGGGALVCETEWNIIYRMDGGFGGKPPPKTERVHVPDRSPDFRVEEKTSPEQALLYRLNGDLNPLHADPEVATSAGFERPILHGLCTYGFVGRAVLREACGGDPARMKGLSGQFRKPVMPGETLVTEGWQEDGRILLRASTVERPGEFVFSNAWAEVE